MKVEGIKDLISVANYKMCESKIEKNPTWYPLTLDVKFLYKVIILFLMLVFVFIILYSFLFLLERVIQCSGYCDKVVWWGHTKALRSAPKIWDTMKKTQDRLIKSIRSRNYEKFISVAFKDIGEDFFYEVHLLSFCFHFALTLIFNLYFKYIFLSYSLFMLQIDRHFFTFLVMDMTIEKFQKVATIHINTSLKAKWLWWWNFPSEVKKINKFSSALFLCEKVLDD